jgi:hypothetical protein
MEFQIQPNLIELVDGLWPIGPVQPPRLGLTQWPGPGSVKPTQTCFGPSPLLDLAGDWIAAAVAWPLRPSPMAIAVTTMGEMLPPAPSSSSTEQIRWPLPLRGDPWLDLTQRITSLSPLISHLAGPLHLACCACLRWSKCVCAHRWKRRMRCSRWYRGEDFLGWHLAGRAGTAPPCRLDTRLGERWAFLHLLYPALLFSDHGLWPVSKAHRACSVMRLLDVFLIQLAVIVLSYVMIY